LANLADAVADGSVLGTEDATGDAVETATAGGDAARDDADCGGDRVAMGRTAVWLCVGVGGGFVQMLL
jgi:hypothetical protein